MLSSHWWLQVYGQMIQGEMAERCFPLLPQLPYTGRWLRYSRWWHWVNVAVKTNAQSIGTWQCIDCRTKRNDWAHYIPLQNTRRRVSGQLRISSICDSINKSAGSEKRGREGENGQYIEWSGELAKSSENCLCTWARPACLVKNLIIDSI